MKKESKTRAFMAKRVIDKDVKTIFGLTLAANAFKIVKKKSARQAKLKNEKPKSLKRNSSDELLNPNGTKDSTDLSNSASGAIDITLSP